MIPQQSQKADYRYSQLTEITIVSDANDVRDSFAGRKPGLDSAAAWVGNTDVCIQMTGIRQEAYTASIDCWQHAIFIDSLRQYYR